MPRLSLFFNSIQSTPSFFFRVLHIRELPPAYHGLPLVCPHRRGYTISSTFWCPHSERLGRLVRLQGKRRPFGGEQDPTSKKTRQRRHYERSTTKQSTVTKKILHASKTPRLPFHYLQAQSFIKPELELLSHKVYKKLVLIQE